MSLIYRPDHHVLVIRSRSMRPVGNVAGRERTGAYRTFWKRFIAQTVYTMCKGKGHLSPLQGPVVAQRVYRGIAVFIPTVHCQANIR